MNQFPHDGALLKAGSVADHIHKLISHPRTFAPADIIQHVKTGSSKWIKSRGNRYRMFHWQAGYGVSVSASHRPAVESYLECQVEHHRTISFQDEYRSLLRKHDIEWNEDYVWD
jgi:putative transposase